MTRRALLGALAFGLIAAAQQTALDRYVAAKDPVDAWKLVTTIPGEGVRTHVLELTSQAWRSEKDVDRPVWKHWLTVVAPDKPSGKHAMLFIGRREQQQPCAGEGVRTNGEVGS